MIPGQDVAMIRLDQFSTGATKGIEDAITKAKDAGAKKIVLDLRGNPGGYVNEAIGVASQFVGDGIVYQSVDRSGVEKDVPVQPGGLATKIPLVVLADGNTASSAEIVTGAIQDADRGKVVGEKTFGTGTVLGRFNLSDGSALSIGVERWLTRDGRPIWHEGLEPDVKVALPDNVDSGASRRPHGHDARRSWRPRRTPSCSKRWTCSRRPSRGGPARPAPAGAPRPNKKQARRVASLFLYLAAER